MEKPDRRRDRESVRILVVDDNPHVLAALIDLFADQRGVRVVGAALHSDDAITLAVLQRPDVVLVDAHISDGGGQRVVAAIRGLLPDIRIFALSTYLEQDDIFTMLFSGADLCFSKTSDFAPLIRSLTP